MQLAAADRERWLRKGNLAGYGLPVDWAAAPPRPSEQWRLEAEGHGFVPAELLTPGERFTASATYAAWCDPNLTMDSYTPESMIVPVASGDEITHLAATVVHPNTRTVTTQGAVPALTTALAAFTPVPVDNRIVRPWTLDPSEPTAVTADDGVAGAELTLTVAETDRDLHRASVNVPVYKRVIADSGTAADLIDRALLRSFNRVLAKELWVGGGLITPVNTYASVPSVARGTDTRALAVLKGIESIENNGYGDQPIVVVMHPTDKRVMLDESGFVREKFERVTFIGFDKLTQGTTFAAAAGRGTLHASDTTVAVAPDHASEFIGGVVRVQVEAFVDLHLPDVGSFVKITGM
jgi:hypothetical protein